MGISRKLRRLREAGLASSLKWARDRLVGPLVPSIHKTRWGRVSALPGYSGLVDAPRETPLVFSLTTFPARTGAVHEVVESLLMQTCKPDELVLWLAEEQYPNREGDLPESLLALRRYGLTIAWCEDLRSYKKLVPTLRTRPGSVVITADDDIYYGPRWAEKLYSAYLADPTKVHCHRVTKFLRDGDGWRTIAGGYDTYAAATCLHKLTGGCGACYPPAPQTPELADAELFMRLAPTNDDIWFWLMEARAGLPCNVVRGNEPGLHYVAGSQEQSLTKVNDQGERLFWQQFQAVLDEFPDIEGMLLDEWERVRNAGKI